MVLIEKNISLAPHTTFGIEAKASQFAVVKSVADLKLLLPTLKKNKGLVLGGGSNIVFSKDYEGLVAILDMKGKEIVSKNDSKVNIKVHAGENWHEFVLWTLENEAYGLENMSLIPGNVGASPIQNIGAYGEELKNWCTSVEAIHIESEEKVTFTIHECEFGYRDSIFKKEGKGKYIITAVHFELDTIQSRKLNYSYGDIKKVLDEKGIESPCPKDISNAVIQIRQSKLPDFNVLGNCGSFFKNPVVDAEIIEVIKNDFPEMPHYPQEKGVKVPAGWLIEKCGYKGQREGNVGSHKHQALVLVNYGGATGNEVVNFSQKIINTVKSRFNITLEREVNIM